MMRALFATFTLILMATIATSCDQNFDTFEKVKYDNRDISGLWVRTQTTVYGDAVTECEVKELIIFDGDTFSIGYLEHPTIEGRAERYFFKDGYLHVCSYDNVKVSQMMDYNILGNSIYGKDALTGATVEYAKIERDGKKLLLTHLVTNDGKTTYERVKGFKDEY